MYTIHDYIRIILSIILVALVWWDVKWALYLSITLIFIAFESRTFVERCEQKQEKEFVDKMLCELGLDPSVARAIPTKRM